MYHLFLEWNAREYLLVCLDGMTVHSRSYPSINLASAKTVLWGGEKPYENDEPTRYYWSLQLTNSSNLLVL